MTNKSLPAYLQQLLEEHVASADLVYDDELQGIFDKLSTLNNSVERVKQDILQRKVQRNNL